MTRAGTTLAGTMVLALAGTTPLLMASPPKVSVVVAHPDDEYYFAGTTYRLASQPETYAGLDGFPLTRPLEAASTSFRFDRRRRLGHEGALRYDPLALPPRSRLLNWESGSRRGGFERAQNRHSLWDGKHVSTRIR